MKRLAVSTTILILLVVCIGTLSLNSEFVRANELIFYSVDHNLDLVSIDPITLDVNVVGHVGYGVEALCFSPEGVLYASADESGGLHADAETLLSIDHTTGTPTVIGPIGFGDVEGLAFGPNKTLYGVDMFTDDLIVIDSETGIGASIGDTSYDVVSTLAFSPDGLLYGVSLTSVGGGESTLLQINTTTGLATEIGPIGFNTVEDIAFTKGGNLYGFSLYLGGGTGELIIINPETGEGTAIGTIGAGDFEGLAAHPYIAFPRTIIVPDRYSTIQEAINNANEGDTIFVRNGTYYEHVVVNKPLSLIGEDRINTVIDGGGSGVVVELQSVHINLSRFTIRRGEKGILLNSGSATGFNTISNNTITSCGRFPYDYAIELGWNRLGHDRFYYNELKSNYPNIGIFGLSLSDFLVTMDTTNTVNGKPVYFFVNESNILIEPSNYPSIGYLAIVNSVNVTVRDLQITETNRQGVLFAFTNSSTIRNVTATIRNYAGIILWFSKNNSITQSSIENHLHGIRVDESDFNLIKDNSIKNNFWSGIVMEGKGNSIVENSMSNYEENIALYRSISNSIYHNNFLGGWQPLIYESYNNTWDNGCEGNYWSDYNGTDLDGDGVGDTELPWESVDYCPLISPYWIPADVNHDSMVNIFDVVRITASYDATPSSPLWNPHADIAEPYGKIDIFDVVLCTSHYGETYP